MTTPYWKRDILDHGYLQVVECWGSDERIVEAARMSTAKGFLGWGDRCSRCDAPFADAGHCSKRGEGCQGGRSEAKPGDEKLLRHLWENKHATPFEMAGLVVEVQAPIFVFREWHRHRTQSYNEMSARYVPLPDLNYVPSLGRLMLGAQPTKNKQAGTVAGAEVLSDATAMQFSAELATLYKHAQEVYDLGLKLGVPKELARLPVPVARFSRMRASANLRNWLAFLTLRNHPAAQWEIRQYAAALQDALTIVFPRTLALFTEGRP